MHTILYLLVEIQQLMHTILHVLAVEIRHLQLLALKFEPNFSHVGYAILTTYLLVG